jgi:hypothetical protein
MEVGSLVVAVTDHEGADMSKAKPRQAEHNAGAFMGPGGTFPAPMRTLSDEYRDEPAEPRDSEREPEPEPAGLVRRIIERLEERRSDHGH